MHTPSSETEPSMELTQQWSTQTPQNGSGAGAQHALDSVCSHLQPPQHHPGTRQFLLPEIITGNRKQ